MGKTSVEGVLKNTFDHLDKIVDEKNAEKSSQAGTTDTAERYRGKKEIEDCNDTPEKAASAAKESLKTEYQGNGKGTP